MSGAERKQECGRVKQCQGHVIDQNTERLSSNAMQEWKSLCEGACQGSDCPYNFFVRQRAIEDARVANHDDAVKLQLEQHITSREDAIRSASG